MNYILIGMALCIVIMMIAVWQIHGMMKRAIDKAFGDDLTPKKQAYVKPAVSRKAL